VVSFIGGGNRKDLDPSWLRGRAIGFINQVRLQFEEKGDDWEEKKLREVCNIIGGGTPSKKNDEFYIGNIPWATVRDMKTDKIKDTEFKITSKAVLNSSTNIISQKVPLHF
jgi:hypothetical protein